MEISVTSFASSSSGNCYLIKTEKAGILLDAGISFKRINDGLAKEGLCAADLDAVLITHEHSDHVRCLKVLMKKAENASVYMSRGTSECVEQFVPLTEGRLVTVKPSEPFVIKDLTITPFRLSHDAKEPVSYFFDKNGERLAIVTDTGYVTDEIFEAISRADTLVIESNHERNILLYGSYPYQIKHRILSDVGHLSNDAAADAIAGVIDIKKAEGRKLSIFLAHLSDENNTPEQALITIRNSLEEKGIEEGKDYEIEVLNKSELTECV